MKKCVLLAVMIVLLTGCSNDGDAVDRAMALRSRLMAGNGSSFHAKITADYGDKVCVFQVQCQSDRQGSVQFEVLEPEPIGGISGKIDAKGGQLQFDDLALAFDLLADEQVSPVSAPWLMLKALQGGYVKSGGMEGELYRVTIDDSYDSDAMQVDVWLGADGLPVRAEILYRNRRILSLVVSNYRIL